MAFNMLFMETGPNYIRLTKIIMSPSSLPSPNTSWSVMPLGPGKRTLAQDPYLESCPCHYTHTRTHLLVKNWRTIHSSQCSKCIFTGEGGHTISLHLSKMGQSTLSHQRPSERSWGKKQETIREEKEEIQLQELEMDTHMQKSPD